MRSYRSAWRLALGVSVCVYLGVACGGAEQPTAQAVTLKLHPALLLDGSDEWEAEARRQLDCDPCETLEQARWDDSDGLFLFARSGSMTLQASDVLEGAVIPSSRGSSTSRYLLVLTLSDEARGRMEAYVSQRPFSLTVNEIDGTLIGVNPLAVTHDQYVAGRFASRRQAEAIARKLGTPLRGESDGELPATPEDSGQET